MRFDVFENENPLTRQRFPFLLALQSDLLDGLDTTVVAPLGKPAIIAGKLAHTLMPVLQIAGADYVLCTPELGALPTARLKKSVVNLGGQRDIVVRALDFLFEGI